MPSAPYDALGCDASDDTNGFGRVANHALPRAVFLPFVFGILLVGSAAGAFPLVSSHFSHKRIIRRAADFANIIP
ncbi:MAG: hypothetical protein A2Y06_03625 [Omnitrophica WOR_2 bacterium GWA2_37_7]|nr:MAG: hypothetical protein A2Y06_03625 [Omnitrophica WOR_2 bacterium GWA2_37_7]